ncbi:MAG: diaminopimelate decarboxylase [Rhodospirillaceae bacterium]
MDHFQYKNGLLAAEDVDLTALADTVGTPFYCYSTATLERHFQVFDEALAGLDHLICFAVKANSNLAVIATLARHGAGADVVSGGELKRALAAGVTPDKIVFSGVGKTAEEMALALDVGISQLNVESESELELLSAVASDRGVTASVAIRINPDVDAKTHEKITTGRAENKFGVDWDRAPEIYAKARDLPGIDAGGIAVHIGSQLTDLTPYRAAYERLKAVALDLRAQGHDIRRLDLGGGLGIPYNDENAPTPADYGALIRDVVGDMNYHVTVEPGRLITGNAGILVTRVIYVKDGSTRRFVIVDAAMNDLIRPTLYNAYHAIVPVREADPAAVEGNLPVDVVGPICETGDTFAKRRHLPAVMPGDLLAIRTAGAYGAVMASTYNGRPLVPEVLVSGNAHAVIRRRVEPEEVMAYDALAPWLVD